MNKKLTLLLIPALLGVVSMSACGTDDGVVPIGTYYQNIDFEYDVGALLFEKLHVLMWTTHTNEIQYRQYMTYEIVTNDHDSADRYPGMNKNQMFYSGKLVNYKSGNREHVWPAANSSGLWDHDVLKETTRSGGSDLYHVRPANQYTNTARGNSKFVDFDDEYFDGRFDDGDIIEINYDGAGGKPIKIQGAEFDGSHYKYANLTEVDDSMKGDVARILAYVYLHYVRNSATPEDKSNKVGNLSLKSVLGYETDEICRKKLIEWNQLDPVSEVEKNRNNTVQKIQGNRNPFVDYPVLMNKLFAPEYN